MEQLSLHGCVVDDLATNAYVNVILTRFYDMDDAT